MHVRPDSTRGSVAPMDDDARAHLARLETVATPTGWQRGQLAALNLRARSDEDERAHPRAR